jgi:hypothetical protein
VGDDVFVDSETLLVTDFMNLKIKPTQSFKDAHKDRVYIHVIIRVSDVPVDSETLLVTDFMNPKIKPTQSFECAHRDKLCVRVFIRIDAHTYMNIYIYIVYLKKVSRRS